MSLPKSRPAMIRTRPATRSKVITSIGIFPSPCANLPAWMASLDDSSSVFLRVSGPKIDFPPDDQSVFFSEVDLHSPLS